MANFNLNKIIIGGRMTADPELKQTQSGVAVVSFNVAVNRRRNKDGQSETDFIRVTAWRGTAEFVSKFFRKGSSVCVSGQLNINKWTDNEGNQRERAEIVADEVFFVDGKNDNGGAYIPDAYTAPAKMEEVDTDEGLPF
jgi:single-strand DNA-binding protein